MSSPRPPMPGNPNPAPHPPVPPPMPPPVAAVIVHGNAPAARLLALRRWAYGWSALLVVVFALAVAGSGQFADVAARLVLFGLFAWQALFATPRLLWGAR